jgi:hypothetical protein
MQLWCNQSGETQICFGMPLWATFVAVMIAFFGLFDPGWFSASALAVGMVCVSQGLFAIDANAVVRVPAFAGRHARYLSLTTDASIPTSSSSARRCAWKSRHRFANTPTAI